MTPQEEVEQGLQEMRRSVTGPFWTAGMVFLAVAIVFMAGVLVGLLISTWL